MRFEFSRFLSINMKQTHMPQRICLKRGILRFSDKMILIVDGSDITIMRLSCLNRTELLTIERVYDIIVHKVYELYASRINLYGWYYPVCYYPFC